MQLSSRILGTEAPAAPARLWEAMALFELFSAIIGLFLIILGLMVLRRFLTRQSSSKTHESGPLVDPWQESARRMDTKKDK